MKQLYKLKCKDCEYVHDFWTDNWYYFGESYPDECCFKHKCPKCKSKNFDRAPQLEEPGRSAAGIIKGNAQVRARIQNLIQEDMKKIRKGDTSFLHNVAGERANPLLGKDVKYLKDSKRAKIKRKP